MTNIIANNTFYLCSFTDGQKNWEESVIEQFYSKLYFPLSSGREETHFISAIFWRTVIAVFIVVSCVSICVYVCRAVAVMTDFLVYYFSNVFSYLFYVHIILVFFSNVNSICSYSKMLIFYFSFCYSKQLLFWYV